MTQITLNPGDTFTPPAGVTSLDSVECYAEGGDGGTGLTGGSSHSGGGGGGGEYAKETNVAVHGTTYSPTIGAGGTGNNTVFTGDAVTITAHHGGNGSGTVPGSAGTGSSASTHHDGGPGGAGIVHSNPGGGGGGGGAGSGGAGGSGGTGAASGFGTSGAAGTPDGGAGGHGGNGAITGNPGADGSAPGGGGGGGSGRTAGTAGGSGAAGKVVITYTIPVPAAASWSGTGTFGATATISGTISAAASWSGTGTFTAAAGLAGGGIVNQWAASYSQLAQFGTTLPALQSCVIGLNPDYQAAPGTGVPTAGNWLVAICGWNQAGLSAATAGVSDDIHSFWRPGDETSSTWAVSSSSGQTRTAVWYTPNLARAPGWVYAAPSGAMAGLTVLVIEVSGLSSPWDVVTGIDTNSADAATSLGLSLSAPPAAAFIIGAVTGDLNTAGQAFAPSGWLPLATVTTSDGADHACDVTLTSAILPSTTGSVSVTGTASSSTDLSGVIIGIRANAPTPITGTGVAPGWPGRMILEAGFGAGYETPPDQITWTTLNDSGVAPGSQTKRLWGWADQSGVPYTLGQLQSSSGSAPMDNADGHLTPSNDASPYYPDVTTGTPVRLRVALGTITGPLGSTVTDRWYVFSRNALDFEEKRNDAWRNYVDTALTDIWSVVGASCPSPYRGEVIAEASLQSWWAFDDQPLAGGVQPTSFLNSAPGNTTVMNVIAAPGGVSAGNAYTTNGQNATSGSNGAVVPPSVATYAAGQQQGWMYGDPQSSPSSYATSNPVTSSPGSAAWQQSGLAGNTGTNGWFLAANDATFPVLADGVTVEGWFSAAFGGTATGWQNTGGSPGYYDIAGQPVSVITLATLSTNSAPVAILQLSTSGHLSLITYNGSTGTSHSIYTTSDLRSNSWHSVTLTATTTTWAVYVDGGLTASVSGTAAGMTSAWTWLTLNGDYGSAGGSSPASLTHGGNVAYSHWEVYSAELPAWRVLAHYCAAATGFGLLPAPQTVALSAVINQNGTGYTPDGTLYQGSYGPSAASSFSFSGLAVATAGTATSGPSARAVLAGVGQGTGSPFGNAVWLSLTGLAPSFTLYTASSADAETSAATINGSGDSFSSGFGSGASGHGVCQVSGGGGASPPTAPSSLGDTVGQRLERILGYGNVTYPNRAIDPAPLQVQAALDVGGQQVGANMTNIVQSDNGMLFVDAGGTLCYRDKAHLAADTVGVEPQLSRPRVRVPVQSRAGVQQRPAARRQRHPDQPVLPGRRQPPPHHPVRRYDC